MNEIRDVVRHPLRHGDRSLHRLGVRRGDDMADGVKRKVREVRELQLDLVLAAIVDVEALGQPGPLEAEALWERTRARRGACGGNERAGLH